MGEDRADHRLDAVTRAAVAARERVPRAARDRGADEEVPQLLDEEGRVRGVAHAQREHVAPVEAAALAEDALAAGVVVLAVVEGAHAAVVVPVRAEAGERARRLADVALRVAARERVQLHQLAREVLVRRLRVRVREREVEQHRRVGRDLAQQHREGAERMPAQRAVLREHHRRVLIGGGEVVVPEERELLLERPRRADHAVEPPERVVAPLVERVERAVVGARRRDARDRRRPAVQQPADRGRLAAPRPVRRLARRRAEAGAPEEPAHVALGPAVGAAPRPLAPAAPAAAAASALTA